MLLPKPIGLDDMSAVPLLEEYSLATIGAEWERIVELAELLEQD